MEILKANMRKILRPTILRKFGAKFSVNFRNNLKKKRFKNFEEILTYPEILRKLKGNIEKILKRRILRKIFLHFGNS